MARETRVSQAALRRDVRGNAVITAATVSMSRYGYYEHRRVLKDARVFVNPENIPWSVVQACVVTNLKIKVVKVNELFFRDYVLNADGKAVPPREDAEIDPSRYLAGARKPTAGCISAEMNKFGTVIWAKIGHRRKIEQGIHKGTEEYVEAIERAREIAADPLAVVIEEDGK